MKLRKLLRKFSTHYWKFIENLTVKCRISAPGDFCRNTWKRVKRPPLEIKIRRANWGAAPYVSYQALCGKKDLRDRLQARAPLETSARALRDTNASSCGIFWARKLGLPRAARGLAPFLQIIYCRSSSRIWIKKSCITWIFSEEKYLLQNDYDHFKKAINVLKVIPVIKINQIGPFDMIEELQ